MDFGGYRPGSELQDSEELMPPGVGNDDGKQLDSPCTSTSSPVLTAKGVENAKKRLRAFSIQKKAPVPPVMVVKPVSTGNTTVLIGRLSAVKTTPKPEKPPDDDQMKPPKPPKPGCSKNANDSYLALQKQTLSEIEEMKRKMELVELGIPLGLVCPSTNALPVKVMPTKAMPPIKTFLDNAKIDEIIREARKAKAEGKEFKFDYQKFVPDYDNPFQRKKETEHKEDEEVTKKEDDLKKFRFLKDKIRDKGRDSDRYSRRRDYKREDKYRDKEKSRDKYKKESRSKREKRSRDRDHRSREKDDKYKKDYPSDAHSETESKEKDELKKIIEKNSEADKNVKETDVNLNDFLVCDSWSLDTSSPQVDDKSNKTEGKPKKADSKDLDPLNQLKQSLGKSDSPKPKMEKLKPVEDSFEFEIDPNEEIIDVDEEDNIDKFSKSKSNKRKPTPVLVKYDGKDSNDNTNDESFLESVINEIKHEYMSDDEPHDKGLVEYDESPRDSKEPSIGSITPDLDDSARGQSQRSDYSDDYKSIDSRKSVESGYKSTESYKSEKYYESNVANKTDSIKGAKDSKSDTQKFKSTFELVDDSKSSSSYDRSNKLHNRKSAEIASRPKKASRERRDEFSVERELDEALEAKMSNDTVNSLETWSFVLKICQPLLFRHDKNKCYKETRCMPAVWYTVNPKVCDCVTDRAVVYEELERCKTDLVDTLYSCDQIPDTATVVARSWYPRAEQCVVEVPGPMQLSSEWDLDEEHARADEQTLTPSRDGDVSLDREYQRFMEAVSWPESSASGQEGRSMTPDRRARGAAGGAGGGGGGARAAGARGAGTSGGWSQDSEDEPKPTKVEKIKQKQKRKRKLSVASESSSDDEATEKKRKKTVKKKAAKKTKSKTKRVRLEKKMLKKIKEKKKKKKEKVEPESEFEEDEKETKKKDKKLKKKKQQKVKKKAEKKKKRSKSTSTSSSESSSDSSSDSESMTETKPKKKKKEVQLKKKKKKEKKKKRQQSTSDSRSEDLFDENVLNNIKTERETDDERRAGSSPPPPPRDHTPRKHREIINVNDFSSNVQVKQEVEDEAKTEQPETIDQETLSPKEPELKPEIKTKATTPDEKELVEDKKQPQEEKHETKEEKRVEVTTKEESVSNDVEDCKNVNVAKKVVSEAELMNRFDLDDEYTSVSEKTKVECKPPELPGVGGVGVGGGAAGGIGTRVDDTSQCSSQESVSVSVSPPPGAQPAYEKDDSHLRPSCDNSNYSFTDVMSSSTRTEQAYKGEQKLDENYENYDMYEQMAMQYQSDVARQRVSPPRAYVEQRIETVVRARARGEIKCDWRPTDPPAPAAARPSRWGLKPGEVNIVLTGGDAHAPAPAPTPPAPPPPQPVYRIQSLANRQESTMSYDEAYMDMYGAADRLQYGDCFAPPAPAPPAAPPARAPAPGDPRARRTTLDDRINRVLQGTVLSEVSKDNVDKDAPEKGILATKSSRGSKRVSFADGYKPGQDSDTEEPPVKKRKRSRRVGCAWPCPASHPDHVPLWDALPPPPPPPGSPPPPPARAAPPLHLLRAPPPRRELHPPHPSPHHPSLQLPGHKTGDPMCMRFMPPEPPPGLISFT